MTPPTTQIPPLDPEHLRVLRAFLRGAALFTAVASLLAAFGVDLDAAVGVAVGGATILFEVASWLVLLPLILSSSLSRRAALAVFQLIAVTRYGLMLGGLMALLEFGLVAPAPLAVGLGALFGGAAGVLVARPGHTPASP